MTFADGEKVSSDACKCSLTPSALIRHASKPDESHVPHPRGTVKIKASNPALSAICFKRELDPMTVRRLVRSPFEANG